jgi:hypothetical protein
MSRSIWRGFRSLKTTAVLLALLLLLLLLNVLLPQERVVGRETVAAITARGGIGAFLFKTLGLAHIPTSPPFLVTLALFFLQLLAVLWTFTAVTIKRVRFQPARWEGWERFGLGVGRDDAVRKLQGAGFRVQALEGGATWGVRNRISPLGFLFFHYSFLFFLAGGLLLHYTRWVGTVDLARGASYAFSPKTAKASRVPALEPPEGFNVTLEEVEARKIGGEPVRLRAVLRFADGPGALAAEAAINRPARFRGYAFLPLSTDEAMSFKLYDAQGFLLDTLAVMTRCGSGEDLVLPLPDGCSLAVRCARGRVGELRCGGGSVAFPLAEGGRGAAAGIEVQYASSMPWVSFLVVYERGPGLLVAGFVLAILGLLFRFLFPRQDVVLEGGTLHCKGEYFPSVLREELETMKEATHDAP